MFDVAKILDLLSEPWVLLILIASIMFAIGNYIDELLLVKYEQPVGVLVIISGLFGVILMLVFAIASYFYEVNLELAPSILLIAVVVGILELLWVIPYLYATERRGALVAGPLFQCVPVIALGLEAVIGTIPPLVQIFGALLIVAGGILLSLEKEENDDGTSNHTVDWVTVGLMLLSTFLVALIYVLFKDAAVVGGYIVVGFWSGLGIALTGVAIWLFYKPYRDDFNTFLKNSDSKALGVQFFNEIMDAGGAYLTHLANILGPSVMLVTAFNATQPIAIGIIGVLLTALGVQHITHQKISWTTIVFAIGFIALGTVVITL